MKFENFYEVKDILAFVQDEKNLKRIRNKSLRQLCRFYSNMELGIGLLPLTSTGNEEETIKKLKAFHSYTPALIKSARFSDLKEMKGIDLYEFEKGTGAKVTPMSRRAVYDYMYALKFIKACNGLHKVILGKIMGI